jgi:hypothetical protein
MRVTEVQVLTGFGHHDGVAPVGGEVHVVRVVYADIRAGWPAGPGVDRGEAVGLVVGCVERAQVVRGYHVLRVEPALVRGDYPAGGRVDDGDGGSAAIRHVDAVRNPAYGRAEHVRPGVGVDVRRVRHRGHPGQRHRQVRDRARHLPGHGRMGCRTARRGTLRRRMSRPGWCGSIGMRCRVDDHREDRHHGCNGYEHANEPGQAPDPSIRRPASLAHADPPWPDRLVLRPGATRPSSLPGDAGTSEFSYPSAATFACALVKAAGRSHRSRGDRRLPSEGIQP